MNPIDKWFPTDEIDCYDIIKEAYWEIGQKVDFVLTDKWKGLRFKATIQAVSDYQYSLNIFDLYNSWVRDLNILDISEESLKLEPVYVCKAEKTFEVKVNDNNFTIQKGEIFTISESFLDKKLTKEAVDEYFGFYLQVKMETYNDFNYSEADDIKRDLMEFLESKGLSPEVRQLKEYEEEDVRSIMQSLYYYLNIEKNEKTKIGVINLLRGATHKEVFTSPTNRRYEVLLDTIEFRTINAYALNTINRKKYTFKY